MTEEDARLALLQTEIGTIKDSISHLDTIVFQIKGWCITTSLAAGGFAVAYHKPALLIVGAGAIIGFYFINCQFKAIQRFFINRNKELDAELKTAGIMSVLRGQGSTPIVGTVVPVLEFPGSSYAEKLKSQAKALWHEGQLPNTFSLYLFVLVCLAVEATTFL